MFVRRENIYLLFFLCFGLFEKTRVKGEVNVGEIEITI